MDISGVRPRVFTPNGDGKNDFVFLYFDNPNNVQVRARVFSLDGALIAEVSEPGPLPGLTLVWRGTDSQGHPVALGVYVIEVTGEGSKFLATVVAAR